MTQIEVEALADMHFHLRERPEIMSALMRHSIDGGADVLGIMPNLTAALVKAGMVTAYRNEAVSLVPSGQVMHFIPFVMITEQTTEKDIDECVAAGVVDGKVYPYMRTTKSEHGVKQYANVMRIIKYCGEVGMKCHFHPEHPCMTFTNRDAEFLFVPIVRMLEGTDTQIFWEHGTDARCIPHWEEMAKSGRFFLTLTAHHLATNEDRTFGDVRATCKPPIKTEYDRAALVNLVEQDHFWVMAGTDSAWHPKSAKHVDKGVCACGDFTGPFALPLYAHALPKLISTPRGLETFVNFTSRNPRAIHRLPASSRTVKLLNEPWQIPLTYPVGPETGLPFWAGETINWKIVK